MYIYVYVHILGVDSPLFSIIVSIKLFDPFSLCFRRSGKKDPLGSGRHPSAPLEWALDGC